MSAPVVKGPAHDPFNPEHRLLNMRERAQVADAHRFTFWHANGKHHGACSCGHPLTPSMHAHWLKPQADEHMQEVFDFARGRKVAESKARELADLDARIEAALRDGLRRDGFRVIDGRA